MIKTTKLYACDFCQKDQTQIEALIAGPKGVMICNECVDGCNEIIADQRKDREMTKEEVLEKNDTL